MTCRLVPQQTYRFRTKEEIIALGEKFNLSREWQWLQGHLVKYLGDGQFQVVDNEDKINFLCWDHEYYFQDITPKISVSKESLLEFI